MKEIKDQDFFLIDSQPTSLETIYEALLGVVQTATKFTDGVFVVSEEWLEKSRFAQNLIMAIALDTVE